MLATLRRDAPQYDVVVVDDGSTNATADAAAGGAVVLSLPFNLGIGGRVAHRLPLAVEQGYQQAVQLDADGQHDPTAIATLLAALDDGADFVVGSRFGQETTYEVGRTRRRAMRLLQFTVRQLSGRTFTDTSSGFRAFNRPVLEFFARTYPSEYMESVEALLAANYEGFTIVEVPIEMHQRAGGEPSNHRFKLVYHYVRVLVTLLTKASRQHPATVNPTPRSAP